MMMRIEFRYNKKKPMLKQKKRKRKKCTMNNSNKHKHNNILNLLLLHGIPYSIPSSNKRAAIMYKHQINTDFFNKGVRISSTAIRRFKFKEMSL